MPQVCGALRACELSGPFIAFVNIAVADFAGIYYALSMRDREAFNEPLTKIVASYLSISTLTGNALGDVVPDHRSRVSS